MSKSFPRHTPFLIFFIAAFSHTAMVSGQASDARSAAVHAAQEGNRGKAAIIADSLSNSEERHAAYREIAAAFQSKTDGNPVSSAAGGGTQADFGPLINLITTTIRPDTWDANGGPGAVVPFPAGVAIDARGMLNRLETVDKRPSVPTMLAPSQGGHQDSQLRKVSLPRLERVVFRCILAGEPIPEIAWKLAGLQRVTHILVDEEHQDLILAGPYNEADPALRLDDLLVLFESTSRGSGKLGCSIEPRQENLVRTQAFLQRTSNSAAASSRTSDWHHKLRETLGRQEITIEGVPNTSRVARVLVAADYHMKLIGMGIEPGGQNVPSYLELFAEANRTGAASLDLLRWWFTLDYEKLEASPDRGTYRLYGNGVQVQCESELLGDGGERVHTGRASLENRQFARGFTDNYMSLCEQYAVYRQFTAVCDLSLACALIQSEKLVDRCKWTPAWWHSPVLEAIVPREAAPREVDSVVNRCRVNRRQTVTGVSGGVSLDPHYEIRSKWQPMEAAAAERLQTSLRSQTSYQTNPRWYWD